MSRAGRQRRTRTAAQANESRQRRRRHLRAWLALFTVLAVGMGAWDLLRVGTKPQPVAEISRPPAGPPTPKTYGELCALTPDELAHCDIALMNLLCAEGLRGAENLDLANCLAVLDDFARRVKSETDRHLYRFRENPAQFNRSEGYFRMLMLTTVLQ